MPKRIDEDRLFAATVATYAQNGFASTTTKKVAEQAGVNEVTLFRRYGSKADLIVAALRDRLATSPLGTVTATGDLAEDVTAITNAYAQTVQAYGGAVLEFLHDRGRHPELSGVDEVLRRNLGRAAGLLAEHQRQGRLGPGDPLQILGALIAPIALADRWGRIAQDETTSGIDLERHVRAFLYGHASEEGLPAT